MSRAPLLDPLNSVLDEHGFEQVRKFDCTDGETFGIFVVGDHGLRLRVHVLEGSTEVSMHGAEIDRLPQPIGSASCTTAASKRSTATRITAGWSPSGAETRSAPAVSIRPAK